MKESHGRDLNRVHSSLEQRYKQELAQKVGHVCSGFRVCGTELCSSVTVIVANPEDCYEQSSKPVA